MKKVFLIPLLLFIWLVTGCDDDDDVTPSYQVKLSLAYPQGFTLATDFPEDGVKVSFTNSQTGRTTQANTNSLGLDTVTLSQGAYDVSCSFTLTIDEKEYTFNGTKNDFLLSDTTSINLDLVMADNSGGFIFKEIYFAGSKTPEGKNYFSDQFHELYNNSGDTLYADSLCIGVLKPTSSSPSVWVNDDGTLMDKLPIMSHVWMVPGDGDDHPVYPGESIIIAQDGIDHQTDENGNSNSPVNLGDADWETYFETSGKDNDAPGVPNLTMIYTSSSKAVDWLHPHIGAAVVIFRLPEPWEDYVSDASNFMTKPGSTYTTEYFMIDKKYVIDAVEIVRADESKRHKRLPTDLDAGYTYLDNGTYCSKSIRRKAKMIIDGRVIYKDTNNSSEDFLHDLDPTPGENPSSVEE